MLYSLNKHMSEPFIVYLFNHTLSEDSCHDFASWLLDRCDASLRVVTIPDTEFDQFPTCPGQFSIEMYYRIIAQFLLSEDMDRILWLDSDIIVLQDLSDFYHQSLDDYCIAACPDRAQNSVAIAEIKHKIGLSDEHVYFNSGVLLLNLAQLRKQRDMHVLIEEIKTIIDLVTYPDQDILNYLYSGKIKYSDWHQFNYQVDLDSKIEKSLVPDIRILHFTGFRKPWRYKYFNSLSHFYWDTVKEMGNKNEAALFYIRSALYWPLARIRDLKKSCKRQILSMLGD